MNDRFKFRVWFDGRFIYKSLCDSNVYTKDDKCICLASTLPTDLPWEQCTGLKDKTGNLIYEGDILGGVLESTYIHWCEDCKSFQLNCIGECMSCGGDIHWYEVVEDDGKLEVIGNIHTDKKLLDFS